MKANETNNKNEKQAKTKEEMSAEILAEKKEIRKALDEKYKKIPNFFNVNERVIDENLYGAVGLFNLGNTCFINSALQLLSNTQPLTDYFLSGLHIKEMTENNPFGSQGNVAYQFGLLLKELWITKEPAIEPTDFLEIIKKYAPRFSEGNQEDIQEFLIYLLDIIHEDLNRVYRQTIENNSGVEQPIIEIQDIHKNGPLKDLELEAAKEWQSYLRRNRSIIVDLFQGQIKNTITCLNCEAVRHKFEPIMYISVPIPDSDSENEKEQESRFDIDLMDCLKEFTKEEKLDSSESFFCESCQRRCECCKRIEIWKMPNILIIHFKRFRYNQKQKRKMDTFINFPIQNLDLSDFQSLEPKEKPMYDLFGVANHEGTMNKGHYYSFAKNDEDKRWYLFDDEFVKLIKKPNKQIVSSHAYMLFYAKTSSDYFFRQTLTAPELWPHLVKIQETLALNNKGGKIRSSTGIRESVRLKTFNSLVNSVENNQNPKKSVDTNKSIDRVIEKLEKNKKVQVNAHPAKTSVSPTNSKLLVSKSSEGILRKSSNLINNYIEGKEAAFKDVNHSQKEIKNDGGEDEGFFVRLDNLADKKLKVMDKRKKNKMASIIEEEKNNESTVHQTESEVLKGRMHVEFIYKEEENNTHSKKLEIVKN